LGTEFSWELSVTNTLRSWADENRVPEGRSESQTTASSTSFVFSGS
jgi:hypothetical protein